jgi:Tfp pilus assembly protein PilX
MIGFQLFRIKPFGWDGARLAGPFHSLTTCEIQKVSNYSELNPSVGVSAKLFTEKLAQESCFQLFRIKPFGWGKSFLKDEEHDEESVSNYSELNPSVGTRSSAPQLPNVQQSFQLFRIKPFGWAFVKYIEGELLLKFPTIPN